MAVKLALKMFLSTGHNMEWAISMVSLDILPLRWATRP